MNIDRSCLFHDSLSLESRINELLLQPKAWSSSQESNFSKVKKIFEQNKDLFNANNIDLLEKFNNRLKKEYTFKPAQTASNEITHFIREMRNGNINPAPTKTSNEKTTSSTHSSNGKSLNPPQSKPTPQTKQQASSVAPNPFVYPTPPKNKADEKNLNPPQPQPTQQTKQAIPVAPAPSSATPSPNSFVYPTPPKNKSDEKATSSTHSSNGKNLNPPQPKTYPQTKQQQQQTASLPFFPPSQPKNKGDAVYATLNSSRSFASVDPSIPNTTSGLTTTPNAPLPDSRIPPAPALPSQPLVNTPDKKVPVSASGRSTKAKAPKSKKSSSLQDQSLHAGKGSKAKQAMYLYPFWSTLGVGLAHSMADCFKDSSFLEGLNKTNIEENLAHLSEWFKQPTVEDAYIALSRINEFHIEKESKRLHLTPDEVQSIRNAFPHDAKGSIVKPSVIDKIQAAAERSAIESAIDYVCRNKLKGANFGDLELNDSDVDRLFDYMIKNKLNMNYLVIKSHKLTQLPDKDIGLKMLCVSGCINLKGLPSTYTSLKTLHCEYAGQNNITYFEDQKVEVKTFLTAAAKKAMSDFRIPLPKLFKEGNSEYYVETVIPQEVHEFKIPETYTQLEILDCSYTSVKALRLPQLKVLKQYKCKELKVKDAQDLLNLPALEIVIGDTSPSHFQVYHSSMKEIPLLRVALKPIQHMLSEFQAGGLFINPKLLNQ